MDARILVAGGTVAGLAVGAVGGYFFAKRRLETAYAEAILEEVEATKQYYSVLNKRDDYDTPEKVLQKRIPQVPKGLENDNRVVGEEHTVEQLEEVLTKLKDWRENESIIGKNKYWRSDDSIGQPANEVLPFQISEDSYTSNEDEYEQVELVWYSEDKVLATAEDDDLCDENLTIGKEIQLEDFGDEKALYFRNPRTRSDYEVNLHEVSYAEYVTGAEPRTA